MRNYDADLIIIGASMAGSTLARHAKLKHPKLSIIVLDKRNDFDYGIGESMLEIFWDYACDELKLGRYLDANYLYKHGLRFFFDAPSKDTAIENMSEMGRTWYHGIPSHQIDRSRFDTDMVRLNREMGVEVRLGQQVRDVELGVNAHKVMFADGSDLSCRWLVDAAGFTSPLAYKLGDVRPVAEHPVSAAWMRVEGINDIDHLGSEEWRERVNFINRSLSTNHFMYPGYWMWVIPLDETTYSVGVVWHHEKADIRIRSRAEMEDFLFQHRWARELFGSDYTIKDFGAAKNLARVADRFFSEDGWFRTGMAAGFIDPLFSSGSALLTETNRMIMDIIGSDIAGDRSAVERKVAAYDIYAHWWIDNFLLHISGNYHGSYQLHKVLFEALLIDYFGIVFPASTSRMWKSLADTPPADAPKLARSLAEQVATGGAAFAHLIKDQLAERLAKTATPLSHNVGHFHDVEISGEHMVNATSRGRVFDADVIMRVRKAIEEASIRAALKELARRDMVPAGDIDAIVDRFEAGTVADLHDALLVPPAE